MILDYQKISKNIFIKILKEIIPKAIKVEIGGTGCAKDYGCFEIKHFGRKEWDAMQLLNIQDFSVCNSAENPENVFVEFLIGRRYDSKEVKKCLT